MKQHTQFSTDFGADLAHEHYHLMPRRSISTLFGHLKAAPVASVPSRPKAMAIPAEELEAMLLKAIPRYRWTADDVVKDGLSGNSLEKHVGPSKRIRNLMVQTPHFDPSTSLKR